VEMIGETAMGRRVMKVTVEIGSLSCVSREALAFSFAIVAEGTAVEGAELELRDVDGEVLIVKSMEVGGTA